MRALGVWVVQLMTAYPKDWKKRLDALKDVDWRKSAGSRVNPMWDNVCSSGIRGFQSTGASRDTRPPQKACWPRLRKRQRQESRPTWGSSPLGADGQMPSRRRIPGHRRASQSIAMAKPACHVPAAPRVEQQSPQTMLHRSESATGEKLMDSFSLYNSLLHAESEDEVDQYPSKRLGISGVPPDYWMPLGHRRNNFSMVGNQQTEASAALVEKLINGIDAVLMSECFKLGLDPEAPEAPTSMAEAVERFFKVRDGRLGNLAAKHAPNSPRGFISSR